jgi:hypothetical protein
VPNIDCLWNESGVHSKHSCWRIRVLYCDRQILQVLLSDVYIWTNCTYCRRPVDTVGRTGCCRILWHSWPFVTETVDLKNQSCVGFPFLWLCYLKNVERGNQLFYLFMHTAANLSASCTPAPSHYFSGGSNAYLESCLLEWR